MYRMVSIVLWRVVIELLFIYAFSISIDKASELFTLVITVLARDQVLGFYTLLLFLICEFPFKIDFHFNSRYSVYLGFLVRIHHNRLA